MLDRTIPPPFKKIQGFDILHAAEDRLDNGRAVFSVNTGDQAVFKIELMIRAGSWFSDSYINVPLTLKMLNEGTKSLNSGQLNEAIDQLGAFIEFTPGFDFSTITIYGLSRHFEALIEILGDVIFEPRFDSQDFERLKQKELHQLQLNREKNTYLSSVAQRQQLFGSDHPYGKKYETSAMESLRLEEVVSFFTQSFSDFDILVSGQLPENFLDVLDAKFGQQPITTSKSYVSPAGLPKASNQAIEVKRPQSIQSSIRIGKRLFNRSNTDYLKFQVANEVLGGYFGSRLMKNIREEKGLTYGIYSHLYALNHAGYFSIGTEVRKETTQLAIDEILSEIEQLRSDLVPNDELTTATNYMLGSFVAALSSPFELMDRFKAIYYQNQDYQFYKDYFETVNTIGAEEVKEVCLKYLSPDTLTVIVAGERL